MKTEIEWASHRAQLCLKAGVTNLNAGTCSPVARSVLDLLQMWHAVKAEDPVPFVYRKAPAMMEASRAALAAFLNCAPTGLLLLNNSTYAVNTVARSVPWRAGDELVLSGQEYHHYITLWERLAHEHGLKLRIVALPTREEEPELTPAALVARFEAAFTARTRALFVSHVTSSTGLRLPVAALCKVARGHGALSIIDGAHAPGLVPVDLAAIDADFYFANIHKWMMGATGSAFLSVRDDLRAQTLPLVTTGAYAGVAHGTGLDERTACGATRWCHAHEYQGTRDLVPFVVIPEVLQFLAQAPRAEVDERTGALAFYARNLFASAPLGYTVVSHDHPELATCMVAFKAGAFDPERAGLQLRADEQFEVGTPRLHDGTPLLRVSCAWFNTTAEIDALAASLARRPLAL